MARPLAIPALLVALLLMVASCGESTTPDSKVAASSPASTTAPASPAARVAATDAAHEPAEYGLDKLRNDRSRPLGRKKIALLVAIAAYPDNEDFAPLEGPVHDILLAHHTLVHACGFDPADIRTLVDEGATLRAIVESFQHWLIEASDRDTQVVFWFCGHGSQVPDASEAGRGEADLMDESLLAYDSRIDGRDGEYDLIDDELRSLVEACPSDFVTVVTDACHSGSVLRGEDRLPSRYATAGTKALRELPEFWPAGIAVTEDDAQVRTKARKNWVHIAAALDHETAYELPLKKPFAFLPNARTFGLLTWSLTHALRQVGQDETYGDLAARVRLGIGRRQTVSIEGNIAHAVFGGRRRSGMSGIPTLQRFTKAGPRLVVDAGELSLLAPGAQLAVHVRSSGERIGTATVHEADAVQAQATWDGKAPKIAAQEPLVSRLLAYRVEAPCLSVYVVPELRDLARSIEWLEIVTNRDASTYEYVAEGSPSQLVLRTREGHVLLEHRSDDRSSVIEAWTRCAAHELRFQRLWQLATPGQGGDLTVDADFVRPTATEVREANGSDALVAPTAKAARGHYTCGLARTYDENSAPGTQAPIAILEVSVGERVAVAVLSLSEARRFDGSESSGIDVVYPHPETPGDKWIESHRRIPIELGLSAAWELARPVEERYLVLAIDRDFDVHGSFVSGLRGSEASRLPQALEALVHIPRHRSAHRVATTDARWRAVAVDVAIRDLRAK